jgi:D-alanyl-D-alanine carboxypeptidase/D-alanyl-D-alanine-endopeptidase (penicillin-binding protein 4)
MARSARTAALLAALTALLLPASAAEAAGSPAGLKRELRSAMAGAGGASGAYVMDAESNATLFSVRGATPRSLASNTKLFTSAAVLGRYGPDAALATELLGDGSLDEKGVWHGSLYLRGGGDPSFGSAGFAKRAYGSDASVEALAARLDSAGFKKVTGAVVGDESLFDTRRGGPDSGYGVSVWVGPLSALDFNRGLASENGSSFQTNPPAFAATKLDKALARRGIGVRRSPRVGTAPGDAVQLTEVRSPSVARLLRIQNKHSDNFFAEMLLKGLPAATDDGGPLRSPDDPLPVTPTPTDSRAVQAPTPGGKGTTPAGARNAMRYAKSLDVRVHLVDGSGLSRGDRAAPKQVARLLDRMREVRGFSALRRSLPVAGRDGTLHDRMRRGRARGHCRAKTGTLTGVSALSGYCTSRSGRTLVFSVLNNNADVNSARAAQDRVAQALARYNG